MNYEWWTDQKGYFDRSGLPSGWVRVSEYDTSRACPDLGIRKTMEQQTKTYLTTLGGESPRHCVIRGGSATDRTDLAAALGVEFASRRKAVYYFTANKLLERADELDRWKRFAIHDTKGGVSESDSRFPKCVIIDDLPEKFPAPGDPDKQNPDQLVKKSNPYDPSANSQRLFRWFWAHRNQTSTIWVLSCNPEEAEVWLSTIRQYASWEKTATATEAEQTERVLDINLGEIDAEVVPSTNPPALPRTP
ncbi:ATP-binding protein [Gemmata massiliana]|uniref:ATP-binding protein n=1 Tax=Gemmata massiliana TaxID=1210884 RepID=UPI0013A6970D|nr:ATP-binding protein [Gemmata massiliana]